MDRAFTIFSAAFLRNSSGYLGFIEQLPAITAHGRTLVKTRANLQRLAAIVFDEEQRQTELLLESKEIVRESFLVTLPIA